MPRLEALEDRTLPSAANADPCADVINFATTGAITLTSGELDVTDSLTINGPGVNSLTVSGNHVSRVFGLAGNPTVNIADLTVANGSNSDVGGGGIYEAGGTLTLDRVAVSGNEASGGLRWRWSRQRPEVRCVVQYSGPRPANRGQISHRLKLQASCCPRQNGGTVEPES
jgi:hypothetical protein